MPFGKRPSATIAPTPNVAVATQGLPRAHWLFVFTAVVFALQSFAFPGIFLMLVAAAVWPVVTLNGAFALLAIEAATGRIWRVCLIFPLLYFGGYLAFSTASHVRLGQIRREVAAFNRGVHVPFDAGRNALVVVNYLGLGGELAQGYDLPSVWETNPHSDTSQHRSIQLADRATCQKIREAQLTSTGIYTRGYGPSCQVSWPEDPNLPAVTVSQRKIEHPDWLTPYWIEEFEFRSPDGTVRQVRAGAARPLFWLPAPVFGCGLNSALLKWQCGADFGREMQTPIAGGGDAAVVAAALGLRPTPDRVKHPPSNRALEARLAGVKAKQIQIERDRLATILADPTAVLVSGPDLSLLNSEPQLVADQAPAMAAALARLRKGKDIDYGPADDALATLLSKMPWPIFHNALPKILDGLGGTTERDREFRRTHQLLTIRLSEAGSYSLPIFLSDIGPERRPPSYAAILGLCRLVPLAAPAGDRLAEIVRTTSRKLHDDVHSAAYVALLRMGRKADALAGQQTGRWMQRWYEERAADTTPNSPVTVCRTSRGEPRLEGL